MFVNVFSNFVAVDVADGRCDASLAIAVIAL